jgi:hypothetical protein
MSDALADPAAQLLEGKTLRRDRAYDGAEVTASIRRHRTYGWVAEGSTSTRPPDAVGVFSPWSAKPWMGKKWTAEDATKAALAHLGVSR